MKNANFNSSRTVNKPPAMFAGLMSKFDWIISKLPVARRLYVPTDT
jgi:hypothetical protein